MPRYVDKRSSCGFEGSFTGAATTTFTHSWDLQSQKHGRWPVTVIITEGDAYANNFTKDAFDVVHATNGKFVAIMDEKVNDYGEAV